MRHQTHPCEEPLAPIRPLRVLIEDRDLADAAPKAPFPVEVTICTGPDDEHEPCPLVMNGTCPLGPFDVVVGALDGPWERSVRAAWAETSTPYIDDHIVRCQAPSRRMDHHLGAAIGRIFDPGDNGGERPEP